MGLSISLFFLLVPFISSATDFPNFFLPKEYRSLPAESVPPEVIEKSKLKLNQALNSIFHRLEVPMVPDGESETKLVRYFDYVSKKIPRHLNVMPAGGVVRSAIGYLYKEMHEAELSGKSADEVVERIIKDKGPVSSFDIRGVGSDFDVLIQGEESIILQERDKILTWTNSAEKQSGMIENQGRYKKVFFGVGDVKSFDDQMKRSTAQGGATIDFLSFDLKQGKLVEPERYPKVVNDLITGVYQYLPPLDSHFVEDFDKQVVRGMRSLVELPFLKIKDPAVYLKEIDELIAKLEKGQDLSPKAIEQFGKTLRNARFSGANNRLLKGNGPVEQKIQKLIEVYRARFQKNLFPEFADSHDLSKRNVSKSELNGLPRQLLMDKKDFVAKYTHQGVLYHGTPSMDQAMAMIRGRFIISGGAWDQGTARYGRGVYTSPHLLTAKDYATRSGMVFEFPIQKLDQINVINFDDPSVKNSQWMKEAQKKATAAKMDFHEYLAKYHGVDVIVHEHVLVQNAALLKLDRPLEKMIQSMSRELAQNEKKGLHSIQLLDEYVRFQDYAKVSGVPIPKDLPLEKLADRSFLELSKIFRGNTQKLLDLMQSYPEWYRQSKKAQVWVFESGLSAHRKLLDPKASWIDQYESQELYKKFLDLNAHSPDAPRLSKTTTDSVISLKNPKNLKKLLSEISQDPWRFQRFFEDHQLASLDRIQSFWDQVGLLSEDRSSLRKVMVEQGIWSRFPWDTKSTEDRKFLESLFDVKNSGSAFEAIQKQVKSQFLDLKKQFSFLTKFNDNDLWDGGLLRAIQLSEGRILGAIPEHLKSDFLAMQKNLLRINLYQEQIKAPHINDYFAVGDLAYPIQSGSPFKIHVEKLGNYDYRSHVIERIAKMQPTDDAFEVLHQLRALDGHMVSKELHHALPRMHISKIKKWIMSDSFTEYVKEPVFDYRQRYQKGELLSHSFSSLPWDPKEDSDFLKKLSQGQWQPRTGSKIKDSIDPQKVSQHVAEFSRKANWAIQDLMSRSPAESLPYFQDLKVEGMMGQFEIQPMAGGLKVRDSFDGHANPFAKHIENQVLKLRSGLYDSQSETLLKFLKSNLSPQSEKIIQNVLQGSPGKVVSQAKRCLIRSDGSKLCTGLQMVRDGVRSFDP